VPIMPSPRTIFLPLAALLILIAVAAPAQEPPAAILWMPWSDAAFERSAKEDKPILLNIVAAWSRDATYSEEEVFSDPNVIDLVSKRWIPVRVDRDRRPDIEVRYQIAVNTVNPKEQGLPLTAFLLQSGEVVYGRSNFHAEDRPKKLGLRTMLKHTADSYEKDRERLSSARGLVVLAFNREKTPYRSGEIGAEVIAEVAEAVDNQFDAENGGFNGTPRNTPSLILELCATLMHRGNMPRAREILDTTLRGMEQGAIYDRIGGGFHSRTRDRGWRQPHFEKLLIVNASIISPYLLGWQITGSPDYRAAADSTVDYMLKVLREPGGAFYVAQWATAPGEIARGVYYSWGYEEFQKLVPTPAAAVAASLYHVVAEGDLRLGDPPRNLIFLKTSRADTASRLGVSEQAVRDTESTIESALGAARAAREAPPVQKDVYVDSSAAAVTALFGAAQVLDRADARVAAREALDRLLAAAPAGGPLLHRVLPAPVPGEDPPLAQDHFMLARAALAGYEDTGERRYLSAARDLCERARQLFWDQNEGGWWDVAADPNAKGYLYVRRRLFNDRGYPSLNALAASVLDRLALHSGERQYRDQAEASLRVLLKYSQHLVQNDSALALAVEAHLRTPTRYIVVAEVGDKNGAALQRAAWHLFDPGKLVMLLRPDADADMLARLKLKKRGDAFAVVCRGETCGEPIEDPAALSKAAQSTPVSPTVATPAASGK